jgi:hypothetical protein
MSISLKAAFSIAHVVLDRVESLVTEVYEIINLDRVDHSSVVALDPEDI